MPAASNIVSALAAALMTAPVALAGAMSDADVLPAPFSRVLNFTAGQEWQLNGSDVLVAQHLMRRSPFARPVDSCCSGVYDEDTANVVEAIQNGANLTNVTPGSIGVETARYLLETHTYDGYFDNGRSAREQGYLFKIIVPVHANRSIESTAQLLDADNKLLFSFPARAHGHDVLPNGQPDDRPWPDYDNENAGLNEFSPDGATPTGLSQVDLNSPEDDPKLFGCVCTEYFCVASRLYKRTSFI